MNMQVLNLQQGSDQWKEVRKQYLVASEAPVIMGASPYMRRDELLRLKKTGLEREINEWVEKFIFKKGHEAEESARPIAEALLGDDLHALVGIREVQGLQLLASYDGITKPFYDDHWEHKQFNKELFDLVKSGGELEPKHYWQLEHQLLVNGNDSCVFACSDGTEENYAELRYISCAKRRLDLIFGWKLFLTDLENYVVVDSEPEKPEGATIKDLPALVVEIEGKVNSSNLAIYKDYALDFIRNVKTELATDQDFADAEKVVKFCERVESELALTEKQILSQAISINEVVNTVRAISEEHRHTRLKLEKLIKAEKENRKNDIFRAAQNDWNNFVAACNSDLSKIANVSMPAISIDIGGAMKNKRTIETLRSSANDEVARAKIAAMGEKDKIIESLNLFISDAGGYEFLFNDLQQLVSKDIESLKAIIAQRIGAHKAEEQRKIEERAKEIAEQNRQAELKKQQEEQDKTVVNLVSDMLPLSQHDNSELLQQSSEVTHQLEVKRQQAGFQAAVDFNNRHANYPVGSLDSRSCSNLYPASSSGIGELTTIKQAVKHAEKIEEAIRDFESLHGLVPAQARAIVKAIYDGQHRHITFKN